MKKGLNLSREVLPFVRKERYFRVCLQPGQQSGGAASNPVVLIQEPDAAGPAGKSRMPGGRPDVGTGNVD